MFGYIRPFKPEMKFKDYDSFRAVYCGVCHSLGKRYGFINRMLLSYDAAFLAALRFAAGSGCGGFQKKRCPYQPLVKCLCCVESDELNFAADVAAILYYYKVKDNLRDARGLRKAAAALLLPFASATHRRAVKFRPEAESVVSRYLESQRQIEKKQSISIDEAACPTGEMMSSIASCGVQDGAEKRILERLGYFLGRWIYLMDAADDLEKDLADNSYNPFVCAFQLQKGEKAARSTQEIERSLNPSIAEITAAYELLSPAGFDPVLRNIVYLGLPGMQRKVLKKLNSCGKSKNAAHPMTVEEN
ncbi:MAG TPA: DUF5685 family protein [Clostridia bacterium]|nr:DUF5685 family protein [Clostridia bacterium]